MIKGINKVFIRFLIFFMMHIMPLSVLRKNK